MPILICNSVFFLFCGYVGVPLLSPVMHNLWIWRIEAKFPSLKGNATGQGSPKRKGMVTGFGFHHQAWQELG
ncbi:hypothetical protein Pint_16060 [Pistacia integerrima]|uniref:Uncharacterized protein n=1 Tax=Pistacia integerrima TaxID=434235 RepID=A0ACC0ZBX0_9ROSI|nr:hypothetical protein Pint_16060 [Pistacia integerrima]